MKILRRLWRDQRGSTSLAATLLLYTVLVLGMTVGLVTLRDQLVQQFGDVAAALESLDQSFHIDGIGFSDAPPIDPGEKQRAGVDVGTVSPGEAAD